MKRKIEFINHIIPIILVIITLFVACNDDENNVLEPNPQEQIFFGEEKPLGNGFAKTWVKLDDQGNPIQLGINLSEGCLNNLPAHNHEVELELPTQASKTAFNHVTVDWNNMGHEPDGIYSLPHFDFHYYMISKNEQNLIPAGPDPNTVDSTEIPVDYFSTVDAVPQMGVHYLDATSPELHGSTFTETFIYGYYFGKMIFAEPMVTLDYLKTKPNISKNLKCPQVYPTVGLFYPKSFSIKYDSDKKTYDITLGDFSKY